MRNLRNVQYVSLGDAKSSQPSACTWDVTTDSIIYTYGPTKSDALLELRRYRPESLIHSDPQDSLIASWESPPPHPDVEADLILYLKYFPDTSSVCLVFAGGDIIVVREQPLDGEEKIEIVGSVDSGISAAAWSPDEELLAIVASEGSFLYMTKDFDAITSTSLQQDDLKTSKHVSVGWGKSETQFKGRGAKALRDPTMPERVDEGHASPQDDLRTVISWRGDGAFVAVNSVQASSRRAIRIYSREGVLDGVSEPVDYMLSALSWRPSGNLLTCIQRSDKNIKIIFFERNGLRHGEFCLRVLPHELSSWASPIGLAWNADSTVLAVYLSNRLQLWTMGNYHYYLKQDLAFENLQATKASLVWHPEQPLLLVSCLGKGNFTMLEYAWHISRGSTASPNDNGTVVAVDGSTIKFTPFRLANVPPPMAYDEVQLIGPAIDVAIRDDMHQTSSIAALTKYGIELFTWNLSSGEKTSPVVQCNLSLQDILESIFEDVGSHRLQQVEFQSQSILHVLLSDGIKSTVCVLEVTLERSIRLLKQVNAPPVYKLIPFLDGNTMAIFFSTRGGRLFELVNDDFSSTLALDLRIEHTEVVPTTEDTVSHPLAQTGQKHKLLTVTLTKSGMLYADNRCLTTHCTSFLTTASHIIFTTSQHLLKFVHLQESNDLEVPPDTPEADERCRAIERGARLVTAIPSLSATILQMPRGNLETVFPRALVLAEIRRHLNRGAFKKAFMYCRNHRVDMNILHDHDSKKFFSRINDFVDQIRKVENIDLFLSQLRNEDVSATMYRETINKKLNDSSSKPSLDIGIDIGKGQYRPSKVNSVCDAFLRVFQDRREEHLQNVITAHCCKEPPDLESGLLEVAQLQRKGLQEAQRAVEHICFLVDVNRLYDTALGLYDIKLALLVAQQSQKDPREYMPFLKRLQEQAPNRMKFDIDEHLGRKVLCLGHLRDLGAFEELKSFTIKHVLYEEALSLYHNKPSYLQEIMKVYANHLSNTSKHREAGLAYEFLKDYAAATESYRLAHMWQESLSSASLVPLQANEISEFAHSITESLVELRSFHAAAMVCVDYLDDIEQAARLFCKGFHFAEAIRILAMRQRSDLIEPIVDQGLADAMSSITELIADCSAQLGAQVPRIRELRVKKAQAPLSYLDTTANDETNIPDDVSLAGTEASTAGGTLFTRYTNRSGTVASHTTRQTSKNRRREERKKARGKKGSLYEEEYLVNSVGRLFERINSVHQDVENLVVGLFRRGMRERAVAVESSIVSIIDACRSCSEEVFRAVDKETPLVTPADRTADGEEGGNEKQHISTATPKDIPQLKDFARISLGSCK